MPGNFYKQALATWRRTSAAAACTNALERSVAGGLPGRLSTVMFYLGILGLHSNRILGAWLGVSNGNECATYAINFRNRRFHASDSWNAMLGHQRETSPRSVDEIRSLINPEDFAAITRAMDAYLAKKADSIYCAFRVKRRDGAWQWIRSRARVVEWERQGTPKRLIGVSWDVDESRAQGGAESRFSADGARSLSIACDSSGDSGVTSLSK